jgi:hypothetical protein
MRPISIQNLTYVEKEMYVSFRCDDLQLNSTPSGYYNVAYYM